MMVEDEAIGIDMNASDVESQGGLIMKASWVGTFLLVVTAVPAMIAPDRLVDPYVVVSLILFVIGVVVFLVAFWCAVGRSREETIAVTELFFLVGPVPARVRWNLLGSFAVQVVVALVAAITRIYTPTAFGILAPIYGLAMVGLWSSRYGVFAPRIDGKQSHRTSES